MKQFVSMVAAGGLLAFAASAQGPEAGVRAKLESEVAARRSVMVKTVGAFRGATVKGAPYSGEEVNETNQVLADGTRIHRETRTKVYRDGEGRTRREDPDSITITDPVANTTYLLFPKTMSGQKLHLGAGSYTMLRTAAPGSVGTGTATTTFTMTSSADGPTNIIINGEPLNERAVAEAMAKAKATGAPQNVTYDRVEHLEVTTKSGGGTGGGGGGGTSAGVAGGLMRTFEDGNGAGERLETQTIEGLKAEGTRSTSTIEAGAIGNDRPIQLTNESWYSGELKLMVMSKHSDPRTGEESFRLTNIQRGEPATFLFQPPAGYQIKGGN